jgi:predicted peptidase
MRAIATTILCLASACALPAVLRGQTAAPSKPAKSPASAPASSPTPVTYGQFNARVHQEEGKSLPYQLLVPKGYAPDKDTAWPLIVWLHGSGENGTDNAAPMKSIAKTFLADGAKTPAFVLVPQCPPKMAWHAGGFNKAPEIAESSRMLIATIAELQKEFRLDDRRVSVGGFSMGGCGVWELLLRHPGVFAAGFPIAGATGNRPALAPLIKEVPIWVFHGDKDAMAPVEDARKIVAALKALGSPVKYTEYRGGEHECGKALADPKLLEWILAQKRKDAADFTAAKVPDGALLITKTLPQGTHDTWTGAVQHTLHGVPRIAIDGVRYRLRAAAKADPGVAAFLEKIGKGDITGPCAVTGTIEIEDNVWLAVEKIDVKK